MEIEDRGICEIKKFRDMLGRTVIAYIPFKGEAFTKPNIATPMFTGIIRLRIISKVSETGKASTEKDFEFPFPDDVLTVETAFTRYDEVCQKKIDEHNEKTKVSLTEEKTEKNDVQPTDANLS